MATFEEVEHTFTAFVASSDFVEAIISSTLAGFGGSSYSVELFRDGSWCVLWSNQIGNLYESEGKIVSIPALSDEDYRELVEMAGSNEKDALVEALRFSIGDTLKETEQEIRSRYETEEW